MQTERLDASSTVDLLTADLDRVPFPHAVISRCLSPALLWDTSRWLQHDAPWRLAVTNFYEQYEFNLTDSAHAIAKQLSAPAAIRSINLQMGRLFNLNFSRDTSVVAHKLVDGQHIGIHNDYVEGQETHRLTVNICGGESLQHGGLFVIFAGQSPEAVSKVFRPAPGSAIAFEISDQSFHAVTKVQQHARYSLVYSLHAL